MLRDLLAIRRDPLGYLERTVRRYGDLVAFPLPRTPVLLANEPDAVRRVLVENPRGYSKATVQYTALAAVTGAGLLTADGPQWRRRRKIAQPAFHHGSLDVVATQSVLAIENARLFEQGDSRCGSPYWVQERLRLMGREIHQAILLKPANCE